MFYHSSRNQTRTPGEGLFIDPWVTLGWLLQCELFPPSVVADSQSSIFSLLCPTCRQLHPQGAPLPSNLFNCLNDLREGAHGTCNFLSFFLFICFYYLLFHFLIQNFFIDEKFYFCPPPHTPQGCSTLKAQRRASDLPGVGAKRGCWKLTQVLCKSSQHA